MIKKYSFLLILSLAFFSPFEDLLGQEIEQEEIINDSKREEVQRYFGYELLLYRYLSLPYDVSINVNQQGNFVDIGILYLIFIPILVLFLLRKRKYIFAFVFLFLCFSWIISTTNSFLFSLTRSQISIDHNALDGYLLSVPFQLEPMAHILAYLFKFSLVLYTPFNYLGDAISGDSDYVTYPIIFTIFILSSILINKLTANHKMSFRFFLVFFWTYAFFWLAFSGGIVWYGYILLMMGCFLIAKLIAQLKIADIKSANIMNTAFIAMGFIWILLSVFLRTSDLQPMMDKKFAGKGIFNPVFYDFSSSKIDKDQSLDIIYTDISKALNKINKEKNSLIWRVGTSFTYFIENNHKRVILDNQMGLFYELKKRYPDNLDITDVMKANGVKYIIVDLNTATIDYTPDRSLTYKYRELFDFLINNPYLKLLATDRVVGSRNKRGELIYTRNLIGEEVHQFGRFAIFEIV